MHANCSQDHLGEDMNNELIVQLRDDGLGRMLKFEGAIQTGI